jgi:hypothetical protein
MMLCWSQGAAYYFRPYVILGPELSLFQRNARRARELLFKMVSAHLANGGDPSIIGCIHFDLAKTGRDLYNGFLPQQGSAREVREWLEDLTEHGQVESLQIVCDRSPWYIPWNLIYAGEPRKGDCSSGDIRRMRAAHEPF